MLSHKLFFIPYTKNSILQKRYSSVYTFENRIYLRTFELIVRWESPRYLLNASKRERRHCIDVKKQLALLSRFHDRIFNKI